LMNLMKICDRNKALLTFVSLIALLSTLPAFIRPEQPFDKKEELNKLVSDIKRENPDFIFIGNSMLGSRIDPVTFDSLTGKKCFLLWKGGAESSIWYLMLKNAVVPSHVKPKAVFVYFRDTELTEPGYRTDGSYKQFIETFSRDDEKVLKKILSQNKNARDLIKQGMTHIYPLLTCDSQKMMSTTAEYIINLVAEGCGRKFSLSELNAIMEYNNSIDKAIDCENDVSYKNNYDFQSALPDSFLPHIIRTAKSVHAIPIFIRVQKRPLGNMPPVQSDDLKRYISNLQDYLLKEKCIFYDFTGDPRITLSMYGIGDHIDDAFTRECTSIFVDTFKDILK